jgi:hypothetical protein
VAASRASSCGTVKDFMRNVKARTWKIHKKKTGKDDHSDSVDLIL